MMDERERDRNDMRLMSVYLLKCGENIKKVVSCVCVLMSWFNRALPYLVTHTNTQIYIQIQFHTLLFAPKRKKKTFVNLLLYAFLSFSLYWCCYAEVCVCVLRIYDAKNVSGPACICRMRIVCQTLPANDRVVNVRIMTMIGVNLIMDAHQLATKNYNKIRKYK